jgi:hypothetical protein
MIAVSKVCRRSLGIFSLTSPTFGLQMALIVAGSHPTLLAVGVCEGR